MKSVLTDGRNPTARDEIMNDEIRLRRVRGRILFHRERSERFYPLQRASLCEESEVSPLLRNCGSLRRMLIASITTAKAHAKGTGEEG